MVSFRSVRHRRGHRDWILDLMAPQISAALTLNSAIRRAQSTANSETELVRSTLRARDEERRRITHELHDDVGQTIATLKLKLKVIQDRIEKNGSSSETVDELTDARKSVGLLSSKIRNLSHTLYPRILDTMGFVPALEELVGQVSSPSAVSRRPVRSGENPGRSKKKPQSHCIAPARKPSATRSATRKLPRLRFAFTFRTLRFALSWKTAARVSIRAVSMTPAAN